MTGVFHLPDGVTELRSEIRIPAGAHDLVIQGGRNTILRMNADFSGRAALVIEGATHVTTENFRIVREGSMPRAEMAPPENAFRIWYSQNGILADQVRDLTVRNVEFEGLASFPVLVSRSENVAITGVRVRNSGSRNKAGRNNTTGGILIEEGTRHFQIRNCDLRNVLGNGIWTHSLYTSPRNSDGVIENNLTEDIGRDAFQVGHATRVRVQRNTGRRIGYPLDAVDQAGGGIPVGVDTAGNVDQSVYAENRFEEINGKCFDLDGFHHGEIRSNTCINLKAAKDYPDGGFGLVMNNNNPDMKSENVVITNNFFRGTKFGAIYLIGQGNLVQDNRFERVNLAHCTEAAAQFGCYYLNDPNLLRTGIYLGRGVRRLEETRGNRIENNVVEGWKMDQRCVAAGPGVSIHLNVVRQNKCLEEAGRGL